MKAYDSKTMAKEYKMRTFDAYKGEPVIITKDRAQVSLLRNIAKSIRKNGEHYIITLYKNAPKLSKKSFFFIPDRNYKEGI